MVEPSSKDYKQHGQEREDDDLSGDGEVGGFCDDSIRSRKDRVGVRIGSHDYKDRAIAKGKYAVGVKERG